MASWCKPDKKDELFVRLMKGEKIDLHKDEDLFYHINRDRVSMEKQVERSKYDAIARHAKHAKEILRNGKRLRYKGEIPMDLWLTHPWFSPSLSKEERDANINRFFKMFPKFAGQ